MDAPDNTEAPARAPISRRALLSLVLLVGGVIAFMSWWGVRFQQNLGEQVAQAARAGDIVMLSSTTCSICTVARRWFEQHEVRFQECFIETDATCAAHFDAMRAPGTPVIVVKGRPQVGFDPQQVLLALKTP